MHEQHEYFSVDWDFKGFHGQRDKGKVGIVYNQVYRDFLTTFGQPIAKFRSSASVAIMPTLEDAIKLKEISSLSMDTISLSEWKVSSRKKRICVMMG